MTMNMLFVDACIRENSRTKALCEAYIRKHWTSRDMDIKEMELYKEPLVPLERERLLKRERDIDRGALLGLFFSGAPKDLSGTDLCERHYLPVWRGRTSGQAL